MSLLTHCLHTSEFIFVDFVRFLLCRFLFIFNFKTQLSENLQLLQNLWILESQQKHCWYNSGRCTFICYLDFPLAALSILFVLDIQIFFIALWFDEFLVQYSLFGVPYASYTLRGISFLMSENFSFVIFFSKIFSVTLSVFLFFLLSFYS